MAVIGFQVWRRGSVVERLASNQNAVKIFPILGPSSLPVVMDQPDERHADRTVSVLEWYDRHRAYNIWFKRVDWIPGDCKLRSWDWSGILPIV